MDKLRRFIDANEYAEVLHTQSGWFVVSGRVALIDSCVHLNDFLIEPMHTRALKPGVDALLWIRRQVEQFIRAEGYTGLVIDGVRIKPGRPHRQLHLGGKFR